MQSSQVVRTTDGPMQGALCLRLSGKCDHCGKTVSARVYGDIDDGPHEFIRHRCENGD